MAVAQGFDIVPEAEILERCVTDYFVYEENIKTASSTFWLAFKTETKQAFVTDSEGFELEVASFDAWVGLATLLGDFSRFFKGCYTDLEHNGYVFWLFLNHYETFSNYMMNMVPNVLAQAMYYNQWSERIEMLSAE